MVNWIFARLFKCAPGIPLSWEKNKNGYKNHDISDGDLKIPISTSIPDSKLKELMITEKGKKEGSHLFDIFRIPSSDTRIKCYFFVAKKRKAGI